MNIAIFLAYLYFQPGGNTDLVPESGFSYDGGISFAIGKEGVYSLHGEATWFDSYIDDWILWHIVIINSSYQDAFLTPGI